MSSPQDYPPAEPQPARAIRPWSSLLIRDYRLIFITILCSSTANHMRNVASLYQVYQLSGSSVQLGLAGFFQALPFIFFGLFGGVLADTLNRKKLIAITHSLNVLPGLALAILTLAGACAGLARQRAQYRGVVAPGSRRTGAPGDHSQPRAPVPSSQRRHHGDAHDAGHPTDRAGDRRVSDRFFWRAGLLLRRCRVACAFGDFRCCSFALRANLKAYAGKSAGAA